MWKRWKDKHVDCVGKSIPVFVLMCRYKHRWASLASLTITNLCTIIKYRITRTQLFRLNTEYLCVKIDSCKSWSNCAMDHEKCLLHPKLLLFIMSISRLLIMACEISISDSVQLNMICWIINQSIFYMNKCFPSTKNMSPSYCIKPLVLLIADKEPMHHKTSHWHQLVLLGNTGQDPSTVLIGITGVLLFNVNWQVGSAVSLVLQYHGLSI